MFRLEKTFRFEAAHRLPFHGGKCARLHGHSWVGRIVVEGETLSRSGPRSGMLIDYGELSAIVDPIVEEYLDHHDLNKTLEMVSPTSEAIAEWLFRKIEPEIIKLSASLDRSVPFHIQRNAVRFVEVQIEETCTCRCVYQP